MDEKDKMQKLKKIESRMYAEYGKDKYEKLTNKEKNVLGFKIRFKAAAEYKGWQDAKEFDKATGIPYATIKDYFNLNNLERGRNPKTSTVNRFARALDVSYEYLIAGHSFEQTINEPDIQQKSHDLMEPSKAIENICEQLESQIKAYSEIEKTLRILERSLKHQTYQYPDCLFKI